MVPDSSSVAVFLEFLLPHAEFFVKIVVIDEQFLKLGSSIEEQTK